MNKIQWYEMADEHLQNIQYIVEGDDITISLKLVPYIILCAILFFGWLFKKLGS